MKLKIGNKGTSIDKLPLYVILLVIGGAVGGIGAYVNSQIQTTAGWATTSTEYLAVTNATRGIANLTSWYGLIGTVLAAIVVLGLVGSLIYLIRPQGGV